MCWTSLLFLSFSYINFSSLAKESWARLDLLNKVMHHFGSELGLNRNLTLSHPLLP